MKIPQSVIARLLKEQGNKCCACPRTFDRHPHHVHHAIIPRGQTNYKKFKKWLDMGENLMLVCWICDQQHGDLTGDFRRNIFWTFKIDHGWDMEKWYDSIPMVDKSHQFIYLEGRIGGSISVDLEVVKAKEK
jgi:hypothetical protein